MANTYKTSNNVIPGGSTSEMYDSQVRENQRQAYGDKFISEVTSQGKDLLSGHGWQEGVTLNDIVDNTRGILSDIQNNAINNIKNSLDTAIRTGTANAYKIVDDKLSEIRGKIDDKINNRLNSTFGKIEARIARGKLGKIDAFLGNPLANLVGGLKSDITSNLTIDNIMTRHFYVKQTGEYMKQPPSASTGGQIGAFAKQFASLSKVGLGATNTYKELGGAINSISGKAAGIINTATGWVNKVKQVANLTSLGSQNASGELRYIQNLGTENLVLGDNKSFMYTGEKIKNAYGFTGNPTLAAELEQRYYNRLGVTLVDTVLAHTHTYIFIGKPYCNLYDESGEVLPVLQKQAPDLYDFLQNDKELFKQLSGYLKQSTTQFMTALSNRVIGISFQDATLSKSESAANRRGIRQEYGTNFAESMANVPIQLTFSMDRNSEAFKIVCAWVQYIEKVKDGTILQRVDDVALNRMSYTCPIWVFVTEEDAKSIVFWAKLVGNFPTSIPYSVFSNQGQINREMREVAVSFSSSIFKPFDMTALQEFNFLNSVMPTRYAIPSFIPFHERGLSYYWVNGAMVGKDARTNRLILQFFTNTKLSDAQLKYGENFRDAKNGVFGNTGISKAEKDKAYEKFVSGKPIGKGIEDLTRTVGDIFKGNGLTGNIAKGPNAYSGANKISSIPNDRTWEISSPRPQEQYGPNE